MATRRWNVNKNKSKNLFLTIGCRILLVYHFPTLKMLLNLEDLKLKIDEEQLMLRRFERIDWKKIGNVNKMSI